MSQPAPPSSSILTHRPDVPIVPVPLLHYASGTVYHPPLLQAQISAYVGVQLVPPTFGYVPQSGLCSYHIFIYWRKGTPKRGHDPPSRRSSGSSENGIKTATTRSETCRWFLASLWFLFCGRNGRMKKADHREYQSNGLVWRTFRGARYVSLFCLPE